MRAPAAVDSRTMTPACGGPPGSSEATGATPLPLPNSGCSAKSPASDVPVAKVPAAATVQVVPETAAAPGAAGLPRSTPSHGYGRGVADGVANSSVEEAALLSE